MESFFGPAEAAPWIAVPRDDDDKYSRGVVGFVTGSAKYPGAAVRMGDFAPVPEAFIRREALRLGMIDPPK